MLQKRQDTKVHILRHIFIPKWSWYISIYIATHMWNCLKFNTRTNSVCVTFLYVCVILFIFMCNTQFVLMWHLIIIVQHMHIILSVASTYEKSYTYKQTTLNIDTKSYINLSDCMAVNFTYIYNYKYLIFTFLLVVTINYV